MSALAAATAGETSSDEILVKQIAAGSKPAMQALFARHRTYVYRRLLRFVSNETLAEDLLSEVFLDVWRHAGRFDRKTRRQPRQGGRQGRTPKQAVAGLRRICWSRNGGTTAGRWILSPISSSTAAACASWSWSTTAPANAWRWFRHLYLRHPSGPRARPAY